MSEAGAATFNAGATFGSGIDVTGTVTADGLTVDGSSTFDDILLTAVALPSAGNPSIVLRNTDNNIYIQAGSGNAITFLDSSQNTMLSATPTSHSLQISNGNAFSIDSNRDISFYEDTGTTPKFFWDASAEALGIGTSSPADNLDISFNNNTGGLVGVQIHNTNAGTTSNFAGMYTTAVNGTVGMRVQAASVAGLSAATFGSTTSHPARFVTADVERMRIDASGNVGINVTSPADTFGGSGTLDAAGPLVSRGELGQHQTNAGVLQYGANVTTIRSYGATSGSGIIAFNTGGGGAIDTERMRINSSGLVGIGITPTKLLMTSSAPDAVTASNGASFQTSSPGLTVSEINNTAIGIGASGIVENNSGDMHLRSFWGVSIDKGAGVLASGAANSVGPDDRSFVIRQATSSTTWATQLVVDASGNLLVGKSTTALATAGLTLGGAGFASLTRSGAEPLNVNRLSSDGDLAVFYKDSAAVGSIGTVSGLLGIGSGDAILAFDGTGNAMYPMSSQTGGASDGVLDFGSSLRRFKDLYLSGGAASGTASNFLRFLHDGTNGIIDNTAGSLVFRRSGFAESMRLDASGNLLVGTTSGSNHVIQKSAASTIALNINNSSATAPSGASFTFSAATPNDGTSTFFTTADSTAYRGGWLSNGGVQNYQANDSNLSDRREKTNFAPAKNYLETICAIPVQTFNYIDQNMDDDDSPSLGVVAQDVQAVAPELITESNWGTASEPKMRLSIYQTDFQYALMKCIQEQQAIIEALTARIAALES